MKLSCCDTTGFPPPQNVNQDFLGIITQLVVFFNLQNWAWFNIVNSKFPACAA